MLTNCKALTQINTKLLFITILTSISSITFAYTGNILEQFSTPGNFPTGLCFHDGNIWSADRKADLIYQINPKNGKILNSIPSPAYWPTGICHDGTNLWCADAKGGIPLSENFKGIAYRLDVNTGNILQELILPCAKPTGLTWDGKYLWVADNASDEIIQIDPKDGTTIKSFKAPSYQPRGLCFDGTYLWLSDRGTNEIYMISPKTGKVLLITDAPGAYSMGMAWDGEYLWNSDWQEKSIYKLVRQDEELFHKKDAKISEIDYSQLSTNYGPGSVLTLDVHFALGTNRDNQEILSEITYSPQPTDFPIDSWGQKTAHFHAENLRAGETLETKMHLKVKTWDIRYFIFPDQVGSLDEIPSDISNKFLANNEKYQYDDPIIQNAVEKAIGDETNPYWIARKIYDYLTAEIYYEMSGGWNTAPTILARGNGSCSEYSFAYISMCRAAGLPARYVGSVVLRGDDVSNDDEFHRWVEIYLPNFGWIPVDPSGGDKSSPRDQANYFGHLQNRFFITTQSGGGSNSMSWTYNSNYFYTSEPKTHFIVEYFADWKPSK